MKIYDVRFCKKSEIRKLQAFINQYWKKNHILSQSDTLLLFQHDMERDDFFSFAVAENLETGEFDAVYGYIPTYKYDVTHKVPNVGWGAIWKVRDDIHNPEIGKLGLRLLKFILKNSQIEAFASLGIGSIHRSIAIALNYTVGEMNHYYMANEDMLDFNIAVNPEIGLIKKESHAIIKDLDILNVGNVCNDLNPYKNISYFIHRYLKHPYFNYLFWGVFINDELKLVMVARKIVLENASCYRIIDMLGTLNGVFSIADDMQRILKENHSEYIDCLNHGIPCEFFEKLGFTKKDSDSLTVIPEYFQPFERRNILLEYAYISDKPLVIFKGDGDQDRPNVV